MLARVGIVLLIAVIILFEAAIVSVMKDSSKKTFRPKHYFHKWLIIWAAVNTAIIVVGYYIITGTILGVQI